MNMNKALQHLYKAISGEDTTKVNISKLLVDIHYAATGVECAVKNNWAKIIDSLATNWTGGGGGGSTEVWWTGVFDDVSPELNEGYASLIPTDKTNYNALFSNPSNYSILFNGTEMSYDGYNENYGRHAWKGGTFWLYVYTPYEQDPAAAVAYGYNITQGLEVEVTVTSN